MTMQVRAMSGARQIKHRGFLVSRAARVQVAGARDALWARRAGATDFELDLDRYRDAAGFFHFDFFLHKNAAPDDVDPQRDVPKAVFSTWTGTNAMSRDRARALDDFRRVNHDVEHHLVTRENLNDYLVPSVPLHPAFEMLSENHKSDYLRCYLLHFHGGGYSDVKSPTANWRDVFGQFEDPDAWVVGYREPSSQIADNLPDPLRRDLKRNFSRLVGNGAFLVRARTAFTAEWYAEVIRRLDYHHRELAAHPARDPFGRHDDYPVTWVGLQGLVFHPLQLKHLAHVRQDPRLTPSFKAFR